MRGRTRQGAGGNVLRSRFWARGGHAGGSRRIAKCNAKGEERLMPRNFISR